MPAPSGVSYLVENMRTKYQLALRYCLLLLVAWFGMVFLMLRKFLTSLQKFKMHEPGRIRWLLSS